jgi:signal transduction histidine kinase
VQIENGSATVEVHDDGVGGADPSAGSGLRGLADRVSALGGRLEIESPAGRGTTVRARIAMSAPETNRRAVRLGPGTNVS